MFKWRHGCCKVRRLLKCTLMFSNNPNNRLGSCGCLTDLPVGSVVVPRASVAITRNYDFDFLTGKSTESPYRISKPVRNISSSAAIRHDSSSFM